MAYETIRVTPATVAIGAEVARIRNSAGTYQRVWKCPADLTRVLAWDLGGKPHSYEMPAVKSAA